MNNLIKLNNSLSRKFIISIFTYFSILFSTCLSYNNDDKNLQKSNIFNKREPLKNDTASDTSNNYMNDMLNETSTLLLENKITLIVVGAVFFILVIFYFYARGKHKEGRNTIIFTTTLIIVDLILDLAFLTNNILRPDGRYLLIPSLVALALPAGVNLLLALTIIINQSRKKNNLEFKAWLRSHTGFASAMTILSMLNIEALRILNSNFLDKEIFSANFNRKALKLIIIGGLINMFIEDIPQLVILIIYKHGRNELEFIPFLTLVSSSILLLTHEKTLM
ncbi:4452_t:CDS:2 [Entrophospora sp. SA101]|nr:4452_t:CDS:2 [Entrophospora sp. SA101]